MCGNDHCGWSISYVLNVLFEYVITAILFSYFFLSSFTVVMNSVCVRACVCVCVRVCACIRASVHACVHVCVCSRVRVEQCMCV